MMPPHEQNKSTVINTKDMGIYLKREFKIVFFVKKKFNEIKENTNRQFSEFSIAIHDLKEKFNTETSRNYDTEEFNQ